MNDFSLSDYELLSVLRRRPSLAEAARELSLSQPTLSRRLQELETKAGGPLFLKTGRRKVLRKEHSELIAKTELILRKAYQDIQELARPHRETRVLKIGVRREIARLILPSNAYPGKTVVHFLSSEAGIQALEVGDLDVYIGPADRVSSSLIRTPVLRTHLVLAATPGLKGLKAEELVGSFPYAIYDERFRIRSLDLLHIWGARKSPPSARWQVEDWEIIGDILTHQKAWSLMPSNQAVRAKLHTFPVPPRLAYAHQFHIYFRSEDRADRATAKLVSTLKAAL